jgi:hypothetical protein
MRIERPGTLTDGLDLVSRPRSARALLPAYAHDDDQDMHFYSIGDFYGEIERGLRHLQTHEESGGATLVSGDPEAQVVIGECFPYAGPVVDLDSALFAIDVITEQGEGGGRRIYGDFDELSHVYRLEQILRGRHYQHGDAPGWPSGRTFQVDWTAVHPVAVDARIDDYAVGTPVRALVDGFAGTYAGFRRTLTDAYSGTPKLLDRAFATMFDLRDLLPRIVEQPLVTHAGLRAAPVFGS